MAQNPPPPLREKEIGQMGVEWGVGNCG